MTARRRWLDSDYRRAVKLAREEGLLITGTEIKPDGTIYLDHRDRRAEDGGKSLLDELIERGARESVKNDHPV